MHLEQISTRKQTNDAPAGSPSVNDLPLMGSLMGLLTLKHPMAVPREGPAGDDPHHRPGVC